jgi:hypothetical protein
MEDQSLDPGLDWGAEFEDPSLDEELQVEADTKAFYLALKRALGFVAKQAHGEAA